MYPPLLFDLAETSFNGIPTDAWLKIIFVVVAVTFITYLLTVVGLKYVSSTIASVFIYVQPIFVVGFTFLFAVIGWSEDYTRSINNTSLGLMLLVFLGVYLTTRAQKR